MTLKQAYEIQRKELLSLRLENKKLKEGTYTDPERAANEKEIRKLKRDLQKAVRERDRYHQLWKDCMHGESGDISAVINHYKQMLSDAEDTICKLKAQMNRDHENSSIPSSQKPFHKKIKNSRIVTGRTPGAQKGHHGHKRPHMLPTLPPVELRPSPEILADKNFRPTGRYLSKQVADLEFSVSVTEYRAQIYHNRITGKDYHAPFPKGISNEFSYGKNVKALAFLLNNYCNISIDKTRELISGISGDRISLSKGLINSLSHQFSASTENERKKIFSMLLLAPSMHIDFSPGRVNGKNVQVLICTNPCETLYSFSEHKGFEGLKNTPVEVYQQTLVHDHDVSFYKYGADHQECLAHVLRYLQDAIENEPLLQWHSRMKDLISSTIHEIKQDRFPSEERIKEIEKDYDDILKLADEEYCLHPPSNYFKDGFNLFLRMREYRKDHLFFLRHPEVEYTNNLAERGLRKFKRKFKQAVTFRCNDSVEDLCNCLSIIETRRQQGWNLFLAAQQAFS